MREAITARPSRPHLAQLAREGGMRSLRADGWTKVPAGVTTVAPGMMRTGSEIHAKFKGNHAAEFKSFAGASKLPFASISAERAAKKILAACERGQPALIMPLPARALIIANALFPSITARIMKFINKRLPAPAGADGYDARAGSEIR